jgi:hypothetical protein
MRRTSHRRRRSALAGGRNASQEGNAWSQHGCDQQGAAVRDHDGHHYRLKITDINRTNDSIRKSANFHLDSKEVSGKYKVDIQYQKGKKQTVAVVQVTSAHQTPTCNPVCPAVSRTATPTSLADMPIRAV